MNAENLIDLPVGKLWGIEMIQTTAIQLLDGRILIGHANRKLEIWDFYSKNPITLEYKTNTGMCLQLTDGRIVSAWSTSEKMSIWDITTGTCVGQINSKPDRTYNDRISFLLQLMDGRLLSVSWTGNLNIWNLDTGKCVKTILTGRCEVQALQFEEGTLVTWSPNQYSDLMIWDVKSTKQTIKPLKILKGHRGQVKCALPLLDGRIISGSSDYRIKIWDSVSGDCVATFLGHRDAITCLLRLSSSSSSSSSGGSSRSGFVRVLSGSDDGTLRIWDPSIVSSHSVPPCLATLHHASPVLQVIQLADGRVVSGAFDALKIWNIETGECMMTIPTGRYLREDMRIFQLNEGIAAPLSLVLTHRPLNFDMTVWNIATIPEQRWHRRRLFLLVAKYCRTHSELDGLSPSLRRIANLNSGGSGSGDARFVLVEKIASML
jgi:WD40 repeat protein